MAAPSSGRVLIYGENGTGREHIAPLIHQQSRRKDNRFVGINCAAIPDDLIESELFGYRQGAVSPNAAKDKKGKLLLADGGTLFLDEIGDMSLKTQAKLVRVIEEGKFEPVGSSEPVAVDTRILAASSRNLKDLIAKGRFREDLFFKLNVIPLNIPPLRERVEDIPLLIDYFLEYFSTEYGKKPKTMDPEAEKAFLNYSWPGNVSELMNVIERFVIMVPDDEISASHLALLVETREIEHLPGIVRGPLARSGPGPVRAEVHPQGPRPERLGHRPDRRRAQDRGSRPRGQDQGARHHLHRLSGRAGDSEPRRCRSTRPKPSS